MNKSVSLILEFLAVNRPEEYTMMVGLHTTNSKLFNQNISVYKYELKESELMSYYKAPSEVMQDLTVDLTENGIRYVNNYQNQEELQALSKHVFDKTGKLIFFVGNSGTFKGKILNEIAPYKQSLRVLYHGVRYSQLETLEKIYFFDKKEDARKWKVANAIETEFWFYQFEAEYRQYILLSEERLDLENCVVQGNLIPLEDNFQIGATKQISVNLPIIILNKKHSTKPSFKTHDELIKFTTDIGLNHKTYFNLLFSNKGKTYNQPDYFQYLMSAFILSSKQEYPLHMFILARQGTGKSTIEECIHERYGETVAIIEGSGSTLKAVIPSFKGNLPDPGAILRSARICVIDEFLRILMRVEKDDRESALASLNPILEHRNREVRSGNGNLMMNPTARIFAVSNPVWGTSNMMALCERVDNSFLSRTLIWYQDKKHVKFVESSIGIEPNIFKMDSEKWVGLLDYLHSFDCQYDENNVEDIFKQGLLLLGEDTYDNIHTKIRDVYTARYRHHIKCLLDGIVKTRCICEKDSSFCASDRDYSNLRVIWMRMLDSWDLNLNELDKSLTNMKMYEIEEKVLNSGGEL